jgi:hypothetical protein
MRDGIILGTREHIREQLEALRARGVYKRRKNPIEQSDGIHYTLREQRSHAII